MASKPTTEERLLSPTCLRVDGNAGHALRAVALIFESLGGLVKTKTWAVSASLTHPGGASVQMRVAAYHVGDEKTYLDVQRCEGDVLFGGKVYGLLNDSLAAFKAPSCFHEGHLALPMPPGLKPLKPSGDPFAAVPPMSLNEIPEVVWDTVDGIADWSLTDILHYKVDHDHVTLLFQQGKLAPEAFEAHLKQMPSRVRQGLKPRRCWKNCLPSNCGEVLEKIAMLIAEGEMYHTLHQEMS